MKYRIYDGYQIAYQDIPSNEFPCMRDTGQRDVDGEVIWECDILERDSARVVVEWEEWSRRFVTRSGQETKPLTDGRSYLVVGNAFENPEMTG